MWSRSFAKSLYYSGIVKLIRQDVGMILNGVAFAVMAR